MSPHPLPLLCLALAACAASEGPSPKAPAATLYNTSHDEADERDTAVKEAAMRDAQIHFSTAMAQALRLGVAVWLSHHTGCPKGSDLFASHLVSDTIRAEDAWDTPYRIECPQNGPVVVSAGPDKQFGTTDDIVIGR